MSAFQIFWEIATHNGNDDFIDNDIKSGKVAKVSFFISFILVCI